MDFCLRTDDAQYAMKLLGTTAKVSSTEFDGQIFIKASDNEVLFLSNNGNAGISCKVPAKVAVEGQICTTYGKIKTYLMTFSPWDGEVGVENFHFVLEDSKFLVEAEIHNENGQITNCNLTLETQAVPTLMTEVALTEPNLILNSNIIKTAIEKGLYAIDKNSVADYVRGLRVFVQESIVRFTSTNGKVVSDYAVKGDQSLQDGEYFFSYEFITGVRRLLVKDTQLFFELHKTKNIMAFDDVIFWSKGLMYDEYPAYMGLYDLFDRSVELDRNIIFSGLSSMIDVLNPEDYNRVTVGLENNKLYLKTDNALFEYPGFQDAEEFVLDVDGKDLWRSLGAINDDIIDIKCLDDKHGLIVAAAKIEEHNIYLANLIRR